MDCFKNRICSLALKLSISIHARVNGNPVRITTRFRYGILDEARSFAHSPLRPPVGHWANLTSQYRSKNTPRRERPQRSGCPDCRAIADKRPLSGCKNSPLLNGDEWHGFWAGEQSNLSYFVASYAFPAMATFLRQGSGQQVHLTKESSWDEWPEDGVASLTPSELDEDAAKMEKLMQA